MKNLRSFFLLGVLAVVMSLTSCSKDEVTPQGPQVVVPEGTQEVAIGDSKELTFMINVPGGFASATIETAGGVFAVPANLEQGAVSGEITGMFVAGDEVGPGAVTLTVVDANGKSAMGTHALEIIE
ncbi:hypothetical protein KEM09_21270 [Carboxylicivirga mesophila]|uniref:Uncharacterized protein n=1 Tax=Carboxylicivirga mesophila TaxID=1166478 RepID=A0ABS5KI92_9BACT|nr:hypothetical protein [Carboxylicivirga mesophila]MBS2213953.1 hypothetical protein [Carboxylicivirga mesophila]